MKLFVSRFSARPNGGDDHPCRVAALEGELRRPVSCGEVPFLHAQIMSAVRQAGSRPARRRPAWRWIAGLATVAGCVLCLAYLRMMPPPSPHPLTYPRTTLELSATVASAIPAALSPLHQELDRLNTDLDATAEMLMSPFPGF